MQLVLVVAQKKILLFSGVNTDSSDPVTRTSRFIRQKSLRTRRTGSSVNTSKDVTDRTQSSAPLSPDRTATSKSMMPFISPGKAAQISPSPRKQPHYKLFQSESTSRTSQDIVAGVPQSPCKALSVRLNMTPKKHAVLPRSPTKLSDTVHVHTFMVCL